MPKAKKNRAGHKKAGSRRKAGRRKAKLKEAQARPVASTAGLDARLRMLQLDYKKEIANIIGSAAKRREREKPRNFQTILIWEMDRIRHIDAKYRAARDRLEKGLPPLEESENQPAFAEKPREKKPGQ